MSAADHDPGSSLPLHRGEALTDGIYAVAMTLLVIELKLPEAGHARSSQAMLQALLDLSPKLGAWLISFLVLALFWVAHHRVFAYLRRSDAKLVALNLLQLGFVSLMPFSSALVGESVGAPVLAQVIYSVEMTMLSLCGLLIVRYVYRHPELTVRPMPKARYVGSAIRIGGIVAISIVAVAITAWTQQVGAGNVAFMLMIVINPLSRRLERRQIESDAQAQARQLPAGAG